MKAELQITLLREKMTFGSIRYPTRSNAHTQSYGCAGGTIGSFCCKQRQSRSRAHEHHHLALRRQSDRMVGQRDHANRRAQHGDV